MRTPIEKEVAISTDAIETPADNLTARAPMDPADQLAVLEALAGIEGAVKSGDQTMMKVHYARFTLHYRGPSLPTLDVFHSGTPAQRYEWIRRVNHNITGAFDADVLWAFVRRHPPR